VALCCRATFFIMLIPGVRREWQSRVWCQYKQYERHPWANPVCDIFSALVDDLIFHSFKTMVVISLYHCNQFFMQSHVLGSWHGKSPCFECIGHLGLGQGGKLIRFSIFFYKYLKFAQNSYINPVLPGLPCTHEQQNRGTAPFLAHPNPPCGF
jgi:hypothetical protein